MVEILNGLAGGAFAEIVEARDDDEAFAGLIQRKTDVAEIGVCDVLQFGQETGGPDTHHGSASVELAEDAFDRFGRVGGAKRHIDGGEYSAGERKQMG